MGSVEAVDRHWQSLHARPFAASPSSSVRDLDSPLEPRKDRCLDNSPRDTLPSIAQLDLDTTPDENNRTNYQRQNPPAMTSAAGGSAASTPRVSPTSAGPQRPSEPYPYNKQSAAPAPRFPSAGRRPGEEEQEQQQPSQPHLPSKPWQSLPSIHEALGPGGLHPPPTSHPGQHNQHPSAQSGPGSSNIGPRPGADGPSGPPNPFSNAPSSSTTATTSTNHPPSHAAHTHDQQQTQRLSLVSTQSQDSANRSIPSMSSSNKSPSQSTRTCQSSISSTGHSATHIEQPSAPYGAPSMSSPTAYGPYSQQPLSYQTGQPSSGQPSMPYPSAAPPFEHRSSTGWPPNSTEAMQADEAQRAAAARSGAPSAPYSESVKRHLEGYDLEASLNEIAESSSRALDFSRVYAVRAHQSNRAGSLVGSLPSLSEIDSLLQLNRRSADALTRIRSTVLSQEHALAEQKRTQQQTYKEGGSYPHDRPSMYPEDTKGPGGFASGDAKKRRGKAAPPGRCHSCNRAETPEWRRGPDGARTLCNACGLHYAKLTRKMGANKASALGSNFRPRSSVEMRS